MSRSDAEMVELLATKVMGLRVLDAPRAFQYDENTKGLSSWFYRMEDNALLLCTRGGGESTSREWNPLTNAADSKMVREKLAELLEAQECFWVLESQGPEVYHFRIIDDEGFCKHFAEGDTEERATCNGAAEYLKAVGEL